MPKNVKMVRNLLILSILIGVILLGWLAGHVIRYSIPEFQPAPEIVPGMRIGANPKLPPQILERLPITSWSVIPLQGCKADIYYTSLPAKCRSLDGRLMRVGGAQLERLIVPFDK